MDDANGEWVESDLSMPGWAKALLWACGGGAAILVALIGLVFGWHYAAGVAIVGLVAFAIGFALIGAGTYLAVADSSRT